LVMYLILLALQYWLLESARELKEEILSTIFFFKYLNGITLSDQNILKDNAFNTVFIEISD